MSKETQEQYRARMRDQGLDHLVQRIVLNAGSPHAARTFLEATAHGALIDAGDEVEDLFLDRLLPELERLDELPPDLVPMLIRHFEWPDSVDAMEATADAEALRPDVVALLRRHALERMVVHDDVALVPAHVDRAMLRQALVVGLLGVIVIVAVIAVKVAKLAM